MSDDSLKTILDKAENCLDEQKYIDVIAELENHLESFNTEQMLIAHKLMGISYTGLYNHEKAIEHFKIILKLDPDYDISDNQSSPGIITVFRKAKQEIAHEAAMCSCFIPGTGQMIKGEDNKGKAILIGASISFISSSVFWLITENKRNEYHDLGSNDIAEMEGAYREYNKWHQRSMMTTIIFAGIYLYSIIDAYVPRYHSIEYIKDQQNTGLFIEAEKTSWRILYRTRL